MTTKIPEHDLNHESYIDPKDGKEHVNHGMLEYSKEDLELHNDAFHAHDENEENLGGAKTVSYTHLPLPTIYSV